MQRIQAPLLRIAGLLLFLPITVALHGAGASHGRAWAHSSLACRNEVVLPADPAEDRSSAPIFVDLSALAEPVDLASVKVVEITDGASSAVEAAAYAEPTGESPTVFWLAPGTTVRNKERLFHIYYNTQPQRPTYAFSWRSNASFGGSNKIETDSSKYFYYLRGNRMELKRGARNKLGGSNDPQRGAFYCRNPEDEDYTHFTDLQSGFSPFDGFFYTYMLHGSQFPEYYDFKDGNGVDWSFNYAKFDRNGPTGAMGFEYSVTEILSHKTYVTNRLFKDLPLMELSLTVKATDGQPLRFARDLFHSRQFNYKESFTPSSLNTDIEGDKSVGSDTEPKHWQMLVNSSGKAIGVFTFQPAKKDQWTSSRCLMDTYQLSSRDTQTLRCYYASGTKAEVLRIFRTMKRGYPVGPRQRKTFDIISPAENYSYAEDESIRVIVDGDSMGTVPVLRVQRPGAKAYDVPATTLADNGSPTARRYDLGNAGRQKAGVWTVTAMAGSTQRRISFTVAPMDNPRAITQPGELTQILSRWSGDSRYKTFSERRIRLNVEDAYSDVPAPTSNDIGLGDIREYGRSLMDYAVYLTMQPSMSQYRTRMWQDFDTMIHYACWDPSTGGAGYFSSDPVARGELLQKLALTFDLHCSDLTLAKRREYAEVLAKHAQSIFTYDLARTYPERWENNMWVTDNRSMHQNAAVAIVERAVAPWVPENVRRVWRDKTDENFERVLQTLPHDGSVNYSSSYNTWASFSLLQWAETKRARGDSWFYTGHPWFQNAPLYELFSMIPGLGKNHAGLLPFGNGEPEPYESHTMVMALLANRQNNSVAQWIATQSNYDRVGSLQAYWLDYSKPVADVAKLPNWRYFKERGLFVFRSSWSSDAMYFAAKCGPLWGGHEHPDAGAFVLYKDGFPYISPSHYLKGHSLEDENIVLVNGKGLAGRSASDAYAKTVPPQKSGSMQAVVAGPDYFNIIADPSKAYEDGTNLSGLTREFVGFDSMVLLRDSMSASSSSTFKQILHGYQTDPVADDRYDRYQYPLVQVFFSESGGIQRMFPNKTAHPSRIMTIYDASRTSWSTSIGPWKIIPEKIPGYSASGSHSDNGRENTYQLGSQLSRTLSNVRSASSLQVFSFANRDWAQQKWDSSVCDEGVTIYSGSASTGAKVKVAWPKSGTLDGSSAAHGLVANAKMVARSYVDGVYGGRELTRLQDKSAQGESRDLITATSPVSATAAFTTEKREAWVSSPSASTVRFYHPLPISAVLVNGVVTPNYTHSGGVLTLSLPANFNGQIKTRNTAAAKNWAGYE